MSCVGYLQIQVILVGSHLLFETSWHTTLQKDAPKVRPAEWDCEGLGILFSTRAMLMGLCLELFCFLEQRSLDPIIGMDHLHLAVLKSEGFKYSVLSCQVGWTDWHWLAADSLHFNYINFF